MCKPFKSGFFIPCSSIGSLDIFPVGFQSQVFWGLVSPVQDLLLYSENNHNFVILPDCGLLRLGRAFFLGESVSLFLLPISMLFFYPLLWRLCSSRFQVPFRENYSICGCGFVVSVGEGELRIFLHHHLEPGLFRLLFF